MTAVADNYDILVENKGKEFGVASRTALAEMLKTSIELLYLHAISYKSPQLPFCKFPILYQTEAFINLLPYSAPDQLSMFNPSTSKFKRCIFCAFPLTFSRVNASLMVCHHWIRLCLAVVIHLAITWANVNRNLCRYMTSLSGNVWSNWC